MKPEGNIYQQSGKIGIGHISGGEIKDDVIVAGEYNEAEKQNLAQAAAEIQNLLKQLETTYDTNTFNGKVAIANKIVEEINNNPQLNQTQRILSALKTGSIQALDSFLDHPAATFIIAALEDWKNTRGNQNVIQ